MILRYILRLGSYFSSLHLSCTKRKRQAAENETRKTLETMWLAMLLERFLHQSSSSVRRRWFSRKLNEHGLKSWRNNCLYISKKKTNFRWFNCYSWVKKKRKIVSLRIRCKWKVLERNLHSVKNEKQNINGIGKKAKVNGIHRYTIVSMY